MIVYPPGFARRSCGRGRMASHLGSNWKSVLRRYEKGWWPPFCSSKQSYSCLASSCSSAPRNSESSIELILLTSGWLVAPEWLKPKPPMLQHAVSLREQHSLYIESKPYVGYILRWSEISNQVFPAAQPLRWRSAIDLPRHELWPASIVSL